MKTFKSFRSILFTLVLFTISAASFAQFRVTVGFAPPALPVYEQPVCPGDGYIWVPGYWAYDDEIDDYYWVPGTWVLAPEEGLLWTPGYWGWSGDSFVFNDGYWGPQVGFYGGINYGFGYFGNGYEGGRWESGHFFYNRSVTNINVTNIHNVYNTTVVNNTTVINRVSYNGGNGGVMARPTAQQEAYGREKHTPPVAAQTQHMQAARSDPQMRASANQGKPPVAATEKPGEFKGRGAVTAKEAGAPYHPPANRGGARGAQPPARGENNRPEAARPAENRPAESRPAENRPAENRPAENRAEPAPAGSHAGTAVHPKELPPAERRPAPNTGNAKLDQKYQQQQSKLDAQQQKERQNLQKRQDTEHQRAAANANAAKNQQLEQRHAQQTQALQQKHTAQQQHLQQRQQPAHPAPHPAEGKPQKQ